MASTSAADHWDGIYGSKDASTLSWYQDVPATSLHLISAAGLGPDDRVIDVGAGASVLADSLVRMGYSSVVLTDISMAALALTRQRIADAVDYVVSDVLDLDLGPALLWHDRAVFHFLTHPAEQRRYAAVMARHVSPGGYAIVATFALDGGEMCSGLPVTRYSSETLAQSFEPEFSLVESCREKHTTPDGSIQPFTFVLLRRNSQP